MAPKRKKPNLIVGVRVEADLREWLEDRANEFGLNMSQVIRDLLVKARARGWRFGDLPGATPDVARKAGGA